MRLHGADSQVKWDVNAGQRSRHAAPHTVADMWRKGAAQFQDNAGLGVHAGDGAHAGTEGGAVFSRLELRRALDNVAHKAHEVEGAHFVETGVAAFEHGMTVAIVGVALVGGIAVDGGKIEGAARIPALLAGILH